MLLINDLPVVLFPEYNYKRGYMVSGVIGAVGLEYPMMGIGNNVEVVDPITCGVGLLYQGYCTPCDPGYTPDTWYSPESCVACPKGTYGLYLSSLFVVFYLFYYESNISYCASCPAGMYAPTIASKACSVCAPGKYQETPVNI